MPDSEAYGARPALETLRHLLDHRLVYNKLKNSQVNIEDNLIVGAIGLSEGSQITICPRLIHHFNVVGIDLFKNETMKSIYQPIVNVHFSKQGLSDQYDPCANMIVDASIKIYKRVIQSFFPTPSKPHYLFDFRDLFRLIQVTFSGTFYF